MRCLALAQAWQDAGGQAVFAMADEATLITTRLVEEGFSVEHLAAEAGSLQDAEQTVSLARRMDAPWVVVDGYRFSGEYQRQIKEAGLRLLVIDDYGHADRYWADLVLNQNLSADSAFYSRREPYTRLLLGTRYALLRREFNAYRGWRRQIRDTGQHLLVTLGGSDPENVTAKVIQALSQVRVDGLKTVVVVGAGNPHRRELEAMAQRCPLIVDLRVNVTNMPELLAWADVALAAGGATTWERAFLGLPGLVVVLAENQKGIAEACQTLGIGDNLGWFADLTPSALARATEDLLNDAPRRAEMARLAVTCVDGRGTDRVLHRLTDTGREGIFFRPATLADCCLVWEWANDPVARKASFTSDLIPWDHHQAWFAAKLADPACIFLLATGEDDVPVGQVRFDIGEQTRQALISVSLAAGCRGKGLGLHVIRQASQDVLRSGRVDRVVALVKEENEGSRRAFLKAGFTDDGTEMVHGCQAIRYLLRKSS